MKKFEDLKELLKGIESDAIKFYEKGNAAAGTRLRNGLQKIKTAATEIRKDVTELKNKAQ